MNRLNCCDDIWDREEDTLASHHVTDFELNILFLSQKLIDLLFVRLLFSFEGLLDSVFYLYFRLVIFVEEHLLFDSYQCFRVWTVRIQFKAYFSLNTVLKTSLSEKFLEMSSIILSNFGIFEDNIFELFLFFMWRQVFYRIVKFAFEIEWV